MTFEGRRQGRGSRRNEQRTEGDEGEDDEPAHGTPPVQTWSAPALRAGAVATVKRVYASRVKLEAPGARTGVVVGDEVSDRLGTLFSKRAAADDPPNQLGSLPQFDSSGLSKGEQVRVDLVFECRAQAVRCAWIDLQRRALDDL